MKQSSLFGNISSIESMGLVDGPGIRVVVFLQGCKLRCLYCHNPETWDMKDKTLMSVEEVVNKILKYKNYIKKNGGVTFSGGEPLLQSDFIYECIKELKKHNIHICIDTSGVGSGYEKLIDLVDLFIVDIKSLDSQEYKYITGLDIDSFTDFIKKIQHSNKKIWLRQVIIPGINDDKEHIIQLAEYANSLCNVEKVELLPYHSYGEPKYISMNLKYRLEGYPALGKEKERELNKILKIHLKTNKD